MISFLIIFFILGLIIGSFLNVLVYRLKDAESILGRSFCRQCKHQIRFYDNVPLVSYVLLRGACRDCGTRISWQYPALELLTALLFSLTAYFFFDPVSPFSWVETTWILSTISLFLVIGAYDFRHMEIPLSMLIISAVLSYTFLLYTFIASAEPFLDSQLWYGLLGGGGVCLLFFFLVWVSKETWMGWGDVWFGFVAGSVVGLPLVLPMLTLSFGIGASVGILAIAMKKKGMKSQLPFAPFLASGVLLILFLPKLFPGLSQYFFV